MSACRHCGREGRFYRDEPIGYGEWQDWADQMVKTHHQERCPGCQRFSVWKIGAPVEEEDESRARQREDISPTTEAV